MGIRFLCPSCQNKVHVKDRLAGLRGFCPTCGAKVDIPLQSTLPGKASSARTEPRVAGAAVAHADPAGFPAVGQNEISAAAGMPRVGRLVTVHENPPADPLAGSPSNVWYVVPPDGTEPFGPADSATLNLWLQQGRVVSRSLVWRQDWAEWRKAGTVWGHLALSDVDPQLQQQADRVRGTGPQPAGPQSASSQPSSGSPVSGKPGGSLLASMQANRGLQPQPAARHQPVPVPTTHTPATISSSNGAAGGTSRGPLTAVPTAPTPGTTVPGSGPPAEGLYYSQRSQKLYWVIVGVLLVGLLGMSVALFYVLDQMKRHKQQNQPTETTVKESVSDNSTTTTTPSGSLPQRTANP